MASKGRAQGNSINEQGKKDSKPITKEEKQMNIYEYADVLNTNIKINRYHNQERPFNASFEYCEILNGGILESPNERATSPNEAINAYLTRIKGKTIVFHAGTNDMRQEFVVPKTITAV